MLTWLKFTPPLPAGKSGPTNHSSNVWYNCYIMLSCASNSHPKKSETLRNNSKRAIGFEEVQEVWTHPYYLDSRLDMPEQYRAIGWVGGRLYSVIFEIREDADGEYYHLITLWKATKEERKLYEENFQS